jgi:hypothetical protein
MLGAVVVGAVYRTGAEGARVVYRDGTATQHGAFTLLRFQRHPYKIEGRLYPVTNQAVPGYEAPALEPFCETKEHSG